MKSHFVRAAAIFSVTGALACGCYTVEGPHPRDFKENEVEWFPPDPTTDAGPNEPSEPDIARDKSVGQ